MPKIARQLSAIEVGRLNSPGLHAVSSGLYLQITPSGARSWILRAVIGTKRRDMGLGGYPATTLAQAREKARQARDRIEAGGDPILERERAQSLLKASQANAITFTEAAKRLMEARAPEWRNAKHAQQWTNTLDAYAAPVIGSMHVGDITQGHILSILEPIWLTKTETAKRLRGRIENVLDWSIARGYRTGDNPARWRGHLDKLLAKPTKVAKVEHHPSIAIDGAAGFYAALRERHGTAARALEFALLTAARSGEVRGATWAEIDLDSAVWTVPGSRMKAGKEHRVALSKAAVQLLREQSRQEGIDLVFPAPRGGQLSDMSLTAVMRRMELNAVPHGLRSTFRDWCAERTHLPRDLAEMALAHTLESKVEAAYRRGDMLAKRAAMMEMWATFLTTPHSAGPVILMERTAA